MTSTGHHDALISFPAVLSHHCEGCWSSSWLSALISPLSLASMFAPPRPPPHTTTQAPSTLSPLIKAPSEGLQTEDVDPHNLCVSADHILCDRLATPPSAHIRPLPPCHFSAHAPVLHLAHQVNPPWRLMLLSKGVAAPCWSLHW